MRYTYLIFLLFLSQWTLALSGPQNYALFFAVHQYQDAGLTNLPSTIKNAEAIAEVLNKRYGFQTEVVQNPDMQQIEATLSRYKADYQEGRRSQNGQLLVFFSGHGIRQYNNGYFLPVDADPDKVISTTMAYNNWRPFISEINCQHILVAIDACYSVTFDPNWRSRNSGVRFQRKGELNEEERLLANHQKYPARIFMTSDAKEDIVPGRSNFARKFLEGLSNFQGRFMSAKELFANSIKKAQPAPRDGDFEGDDPRSSFLFFPRHEIPQIDTKQYNQRQRDMQVYRAIIQDPTIEKCQQYLQDFPNGNFIGEVSQQLLGLQDEQEWEFTLLKNTEASYQNYLELFPEGFYAIQARNQLHEYTSKPTNLNFIPPLAQAPELDKMVFVQGGTFQMGSQEGSSNEIPHSVTLSNYYIARNEVTFEEFDLFCSDTGRKKPHDQGWGRQNRPVIYVSWYDALEYCNWLSQKEGLEIVYTIDKFKHDYANNSSYDDLKWSISINWDANGYRLPTEAEWEYAARSRGKDEKWAGTSLEEQLASYANGSGTKDGFDYTSPVSSFKANDLGLFDMSGNVREWCWDWYESYFNHSKGNPKGPNSGSFRVIRSGSWLSLSTSLRCTERYFEYPSYRYYFIGFRLSRSNR